MKATIFGTHGILACKLSAHPLNSCHRMTSCRLFYKFKESFTTYVVVVAVAVAVAVAAVAAVAAAIIVLIIVFNVVVFVVC